MVSGSVKRAPKKVASSTSSKSSKSTKSCSSLRYSALCEDEILDASSSLPGQDAIFCTGTCDSWLHRGCAGLSKPAFD